MYGSIIGDLMAADPSFAIPGVVPSRREPVLPKEDSDPTFRRLIDRVPTRPIRDRPGGVSLPLAQSDMQEKMQPALPPVRKAANDMLEEYIAQLAPRIVRNAVSPSNLPYIQTPAERRADEMLMQRLGKDLSEDDMRFFLEGNYGFRGV